MAEKYRKNVDPTQAGVHNDVTYATSERSRAGMMFPLAVLLVVMAFFGFLFSRTFMGRGSGTSASNITAGQSGQQRMGQGQAQPAAAPNGVYPPQR